MMDQDIDEGDYAFSFNYQPTSPAEKNITKSIDKGKIPERPPVQYASNDINDLLTQFSVDLTTKKGSTPTGDAQRSFHPFFRNRNASVFKFTHQ